MSWDGRVMGRFSRGYRRLPGLDTIDEVLLVVVGPVKLHLVTVRGDFTEPIDIGGIEATAIYPNPSVSADPLGTAFDIVVTARENHADTVRILAGNPILAARV